MQNKTPLHIGRIKWGTVSQWRAQEVLVVFRVWDDALETCTNKRTQLNLVNNALFFEGGLFRNKQQVFVIFLQKNLALFLSHNLALHR